MTGVAHAKGRLVFQGKIDGRDKPVHHVKVQFVYLGPIGTEVVCNKGFDGKEAETDLEGNFEIVFKPRWFRMRDVKLRVMRTEVHYTSEGRDNTREQEALGYLPIREYSVPEDGIFEFGTKRIAYWEYDQSGLRPTPRLKVDERHPLSQKHRFGRLLRKRKAEMMTAVFMNPVTFPIFEPQNTTKRMRKDFNTGSTVKKGAINPESDEYLVDMALNGFNPCAFQRADDGRYFVAFKWQGVLQDGQHFAPDTAAFFVAEGPEEDVKFRLESIQLQRRRLESNFTPAGNCEMAEPETFTPADGELWERAKRVWRNDYFLWGEVFTHLGSTHLNAEQYILPFERNIQRNPIRKLLSPHFFGCVTVNIDADKMILGENGFLIHTSAATALSAGVGIRSGFHQYNWHGWSPRRPLCKDHKFAHIQVLFWDVVEKYVDYFFAENQRDIEQHWVEIVRFNEELMRNSVPYVQDDEPWVCLNEVNKSYSPRTEVRGRPVAVSPVTLDHAITAENRAENMGNLKQMCRYLIFQCTLKHGYVNDRQFDLGGDPDFASLGVRKDITDLTVDPKDAITDTDRRMHILLTDILSNLKYGYIMADEDSDVHPELKRLLKAKTAEFRKAGMPIETIRSCINI